MNKRVLVTGFEPFGGRESNASWQAVSLLPNSIEGWEIVKLCLPVEFDRAAALCIARANVCKAVAVVCVGEASGREVTPETTAVNRRVARIPDNAGASPQGEKIDEDGREELSSTLPIDDILAACLDNGLPVALSHTAGEYVCNDLFYQVVQALGGRVPVGFVHVPLPDRVAAETSAKVLQIAIERTIALPKVRYMADPCGESSVSFYKSESLVVPQGMAIAREDEFDPVLYAHYLDDPYFRLSRSLDGVQRPALPQGFVLADPALSDFVGQLRSCYKGAPSLPEFKRYRCQPTYQADLWIAVKDVRSGTIVATAIGELDERIGELSIEWVQVSNGYRRRGLGSYLVNELLYRAQNRATFATVSGEVANPSHPMVLYRRLGFADQVIWHVLTQKE